VTSTTVLDRSAHDRKSFSCGVPELDAYLKTRAAQDMKARASVCWVLPTTDDDGRHDTHGEPSPIIGYYTLSNLGVLLEGLPDEVAKRLPKYPQIGATLIGRLAVDEKHRGRGWGEILLMDALKRCLHVSRLTGSAFVVVDAKNEGVASFYEKFGFQRFPNQLDRLFMPVKVISEIFKDGSAHEISYTNRTG